MKSYGYVARDLTGVLKKGFLQAACSNEVLNKLRKDGFTPISVKEIAPTTQKTQKRTRRRRIKASDLATLCWQLATMLQGGIPITTALDIISDDTDNSLFSNILQEIAEKVRKGQPFSESVAEFPRVFNRLSCAMVLAGETSGNLANVVGKLAEYYDNRDKITKKVKGAMAYPLFVLTFIVLIVVFIMAFIVPRFRGIFDQMGGTMPAFTRGFMAFYDMLAHNILYMLGALVLSIFLFVSFTKTPKGHYWLSKTILKIPVFGKIISYTFVTTFCKTTSTLLIAGVSVLDAFNILTGMTNNDIIKSAILQTKENIEGGSNISSSMSATGFFPNMLVKMIQVGEESGSTAEVLEKTSEHYERKVDTAITALMSLLEPVMIVTVGAIVSVIVIALYLPIFTMSDM
jgi:type IV pilus assembly protein PilC